MSSWVWFGSCTSIGIIKTGSITMIKVAVTCPYPKTAPTKLITTTSGLTSTCHMIAPTIFFNQMPTSRTFLCSVCSCPSCEQFVRAKAFYSGSFSSSFFT